MSRRSAKKKNSIRQIAGSLPKMGKIILILVIALIVVFSVKAATLSYEVTSYKSASSSKGDDVEVTITADMDISDLGNLLIEKGIINESLEAFLIQENLSDYHDKYISGTYVLNPNMTVEEILKTISTTEDEQ